MRPYLWVAILSAILYGCSILMSLPDVARVALALVSGLLLLISIFYCISLMKCPYCGWKLTSKKSHRLGEYTSWSLPQICPSCHRNLDQPFDPSVLPNT